MFHSMTLYNHQNDTYNLSSAGAVHSPHLLLLSGIGSAKQLAQHNIPLIHELAGVGQHLKDHAAVNAIFEIAKGESYMHLTRWNLSGLISLLPKFVEWLRHGTGPLSTSVRYFSFFSLSTSLTWIVLIKGIEGAAFVRSDDPVLFPKAVFPESITDMTSGNKAPDIEMLSSPFARFEHKFFHPAVPKTDLGSVVTILLR